jgi:hypothetical protein
VAALKKQRARGDKMSEKIFNLNVKNNFLPRKYSFVEPAREESIKVSNSSKFVIPVRDGHFDHYPRSQKNIDNPLVRQNEM